MKMKYLTQRGMTKSVQQIYIDKLTDREQVILALFSTYYSKRYILNLIDNFEALDFAYLRDEFLDYSKPREDVILNGDLLEFYLKWENNTQDKINYLIPYETLDIFYKGLQKLVIQNELNCELIIDNSPKQKRIKI